MDALKIGDNLFFISLIYSFTPSLAQPSISVTPDSLSSSLYTGEVMQQTLAISNIGSDSLNFSISLDFPSGRGSQNYALQFDGMDDFVRILHSSVFDFGSGPFTFSVWIYTNATTGTIYARDDIIAKGDPSETGFALSSRNDKAKVWLGWYTSLPGAQSISNINDGAWHHIAFTRDNFNDVNLYFDGVIEYSNDLFSI